MCAAQPRRHKWMVIKRIRWEKPDQGWLNLNTDGSWNEPLGLAAGGGVIRDSWGNWVASLLENWEVLTASRLKFGRYVMA